ncbi:MAG TPA: RNA polymerase subunit sigma, partial [Pedobacter sp.]
NLWDQELIQQGLHFLNQSSRGKQLSKYHLEAGIAYWHTFKQDTTEKWERILQLYNQLIILDDSPVAALNRTYALYKAHGKRQAIIEAEKLRLTNDHLYYSLLGTLYAEIDNDLALTNFQLALSLTKTAEEKSITLKSIEALKNS